MATKISPSLAVTQKYHRFPCRPRSSYLSIVFRGNSDAFVVVRMVVARVFAQKCWDGGEAVIPPPPTGFRIQSWPAAALGSPRRFPS